MVEQEPGRAACGELTLPEFLGAALKLYGPILLPMAAVEGGRNYIGLCLDRYASPVFETWQNAEEVAAIGDQVAKVTDRMRALVDSCPPMVDSNEGMTFVVTPRRIEAAVSALENGIRASRAADQYKHGMMLNPSRLSLSTGIDLSVNPRDARKRLLPGLKAACSDGLDAVIAYMEASRIAFGDGDASLALHWAFHFPVNDRGVSVEDREGFQMIVAEGAGADLTFVTATRAERLELIGNALFASGDVLLESIEETLPDLLDATDHHPQQDAAPCSQP